MKLQDTSGTLAFVFAALAATAGLSGWGTGWLLLFWAPALVLTLLVYLAGDGCSTGHRHSGTSSLLPVPDANGAWQLTGGEQCGHDPLSVTRHRRAYVTSALTSVAFADAAGRLYRFTFTPAALDRDRYRRLRLALRVGTARK